ncbi:MAG: hypothetical protein HRF49_10085 [bacterium]
MRKKKLHILLVAAGEAAGLGFVPVLLGIFIAKLRVWPFDSVLIASILGAALAAGWFAYRGLLRRVRLTECTQDADRALDLKDRLTSAILLEKEAASDPMVASLVADAEEKSARAVPSRVYPWKFPKSWRLSGASAALTIMVLFVPYLGWLENPAKEAERKQVQEAGKRLVRLARELEKQARKVELSKERELSAELEKLGKKFEFGKIEKGKALENLNSLKDELQAAKETDNFRAESEFLSSLGKKLLEHGANSRLAEAMKSGEKSELGEELESLKAALEAGKMSDAELAQFEKMFESLKQTLAEAKNLPESFDREALERALKKLEENLQKEKELREAMSQLLEKLEQKLGEYCQSLQKAGQGKEGEAMQAALSEMKSQFESDGSISLSKIAELKESVKSADSKTQQGGASQQLKEQAGRQAEEILKMLGEADKNQCDSGG